jgi:hypothetical protein
MSLTIRLFLVFLMLPIFSNGQVSIKGKVVNARNRPITAHIYKHVSKEGDIKQLQHLGKVKGSFKLSLDSLDEIVYYYIKLGGKLRSLTNWVSDTSFATIVRPKKRLIRKRVRRYHPYPNLCCFAEGTEILMANQSQSNIEELTVGDSILSFNFNTNSFEKDEILKIDTVLHDNVSKLKLANGFATITATTDHPFFIAGKDWCSLNPEETFRNYGLKVGQIESGDSCYHYKNGELGKVEILAIKNLKGTFKTYNLTELAKNNNYFANLLFVGNEKYSQCLKVELAKSAVKLRGILTP